MSNEKKRQFVDEYNAAETLYQNDLMDVEAYYKTNIAILRTIISHFAMELNKVDKEEVKDE